MNLKKYSFTLLFLILLSTFIRAQTVSKQTEELKQLITERKKEGQLLSRLYLTDYWGNKLYNEKKSENADSTGEHFSYFANGRFVFVKISSDTPAQVIATFIYTNSLEGDSAIQFWEPRGLSYSERTCFKLKQQTMALMNVKGNFYHHYSNTTETMLPLVDDNGKLKTFVITESVIDSSVFFGNDYEMNFDSGFNLIMRKAYHKNPTSSNTSADLNIENLKFEVHLHLKKGDDDFITATDIAWLLLFEHITNWDYYFVISKKYVSIWDCYTNDLVILTRKDYEKSDFISVMRDYHIE